MVAAVYITDWMDSIIPDRWHACPPFGEVIDDLFLPLKTPLSEDIPLPQGYEFTPDVFIKQTKDRKLNVGLLINLSYTNKYYHPDDFIDNHNIQYKHISCRGHNEAPQPKERAEFIKTCNSFLAKNPQEKLIAVHCTHGFNRTGFMICCFLHLERDWAIDAAIAEFATKRPPGIYKQDYLDALVKEFGDHDDPIIPAPPKPIWDSEVFIVTPGNDSSRNAASNSQREFYEGITDVHLVRDDGLKHRIYRHCCILCNYNVNSQQASFPGAQPVSLDQTNISLLGAHRYRVSWKADGCRFMLYIQDENNIFFLTRNVELWRVVGLRFPRLEDLNSHLTDTLVDGEMVTDLENGRRIPRFLIYDVISLNGEIVAKDNFDKRCWFIKSVIVEARRNAKLANLIPLESEPFKVADKGFFYLDRARKTWNLPVLHEKDGLIFQPLSAPYTGGTCPYILKWKPPNLNSIDFRLVIREERKNGCLPENWACLHVSNKAEPITKFALSRDQSSFHQYNGKIVEMTLNQGKWTVIRERNDKLTPNSAETASAVYKSITQPITEDNLFKYIDRLPADKKRS